jgi:hypothetical protein
MVGEENQFRGTRGGENNKLKIFLEKNPRVEAGLSPRVMVKPQRSSRARRTGKILTKN